MREPHSATYKPQPIHFDFVQSDSPLAHIRIFSRILISSLRFYNLLQVKLRNLLTGRTPHEGSREGFGDGVVS